MEVDLIKLAVGSVAVVMTALAAMMRYSIGANARALEAERTARADLEYELRSDIAAERGEAQSLRRRVKDLETGRMRDKAELSEAQTEICTMRAQVGTLLTGMSALQEKVTILKQALDESQDREAQKDREISDLRTERDQLLAQNHDLKTANATYERALSLVGLERTEKTASSGNEAEKKQTQQPEETQEHE